LLILVFEDNFSWTKLNRYTKGEISINQPNDNYFVVYCQ